ncbi:unnamed protein product [Dibothriocephalus latus]|uniref:Uncharacterized protein n=1 Tax=Dibothriocephalus latus TaxID=60516 RepID=A0A3P7QGS5_DIBLA|nr:unnamed protein product [Dibothriocephalus latus]
MRCSRQTLAGLFKFFFLTAVNLPLNAANCSKSRNLSDPSGVKPATGLSAANTAVNTRVIVNILGNGDGFVDVGDYDEDGKEEIKEDYGRWGRRGKESGGEPTTAARTEGLAKKPTVPLKPRKQTVVDSKRTQTKHQGNHNVGEKKRAVTEREKILDEILRTKIA